MPQSDHWEYYGVPVDVVAIHSTSLAALVGKAECWDKKGHVFFVSFALTDNYKFSDVTGYGRGPAKQWRLSQASMDALTGTPGRVMKEPPPRKPRRASKPAAEDPRQTKIEGA